MSITKSKLIILDGARGAGKSTVSALLRDMIENGVFVGLDLMRNLITKSKATDEFNDIAFDALFSITNSFLSHGVHVVMDSGLKQERVQKVKDIAVKQDAAIFMYYLSAPKEVLWERIQKRGKERGKMPSRERFEYTFEKQQSKNFSDFIEIDSTKYTPEEIAQQIYTQVFNYTISTI